MTVNNYLELILFGIANFKRKEINLTFEENILKFQHAILKAELDFEKKKNILKVNFTKNLVVAINHLESCTIDRLNSKFESDKSPLYKIIFPEYSNEITNIEDYYSVLFNIPSLDGSKKIGELCYNDIIFLLSVSRTINDVQLQDESFKFENKFDKVSEEKVYNHFRDHFVPNDYIKIHVLEEFLKNAFELSQSVEPKIIFNKKMRKHKVRKIFYEYYILAQSPYGEQDKYIRLLTDNFHGFEFEKIKANFSK